MAHTFKLSRRIARLRAPVFATIILTLVGCNNTDSLDPDGSTPAEAVDRGLQAGVQVAKVDNPSFASASFAGGIPIGTFAQPTTEFGNRFNGAKQNIAPRLLRIELAAIKARGGKVVLMFAGNERYYKEAGHFSLDKWKARVNRYKGIDFSSYIDDGTIIGHYMIDEPNDPANWNGKPVPPSLVEEMAKYSKQLWPNMVTVVRADPAYFVNGSYQYLDAAWAQYLTRKGSAAGYIAKRVADAQKAGLGLIVGLNLLHGGTPNGTTMTASEVESFGSALLSSSYPCAFISWQYNSAHLGSSGMGSAMDALRRKAESRAAKSCRGS